MFTSETKTKFTPETLVIRSLMPSELNDWLNLMANWSLPNGIDSRAFFRKHIDNNATHSSAPSRGVKKHNTNNDKHLLNESKINLNKADVNALEDLPGIGETRAKAIIAFREQHHGFNSIDDLLKVKGIGHSLLEKIKKYLILHKG